MIFPIITAGQNISESNMRNQINESSEASKPDPADTNLSCKLSSADLQKRKATVLESLRSQMIERKELEYGYAFKFPGSNEIIDELTEFVKTERECCDFFNFSILINGDKSEAWLEITGPLGTKSFIEDELELGNHNK